MKATTVTLLFAMLALAPALAQNSQERPLSQAGIDRITREVRHELLLLPYYGVFDNLAYKVGPDGTVTLLGAGGPPEPEVRRGKCGEED